MLCYTFSQLHLASGSTAELSQLLLHWIYLHFDLQQISINASGMHFSSPSFCELSAKCSSWYVTSLFLGSSIRTCSPKQYFMLLAIYDSLLSSLIIWRCYLYAELFVFIIFALISIFNKPFTKFIFFFFLLVFLLRWIKNCLLL